MGELGSTAYGTRFRDVPGRVKSKTSFPLADTWVKYLGPGKAWGSAVVLVNAELEEAAAFWWDFVSRVHKSTTGDIARQIIERKGDWEIVTRRIQKSEGSISGLTHGRGAKAREFLNLMKLEKSDEDTIIIVMDPFEDSIVNVNADDDDDLQGEGNEERGGRERRATEVRRSEERSNELTTSFLETKTTRARTSVQDAAPL
jgi:hypothetical protein